MINIFQNATAIGRLGITSFSGVGGVAPYVYSVLPGGAGGSIDSFGEYTAPQVFGKDTIQVMDDNGDTALAEISILNPYGLLCDIIQKELELGIGRVVLWNQKVEIPKDHGIFIAVSVQSCKPFANSSRFEGTNYIQSTNFNAQISIDVMSRGNEARDRKEEVVMALNSYYAQTQQLANGFYLGILPTSFNNVSTEDGAAIPYRFNIAVNMQYQVTKIKPVKYYDSFEDELLTNF